MAAYSNVRCLLLIFLLASANSLAQRPETSGRAVQKVALREVSTVAVPSLPAESIGPPLLCDAEGRTLFRMAMPDTGLEDPVSVSKDGKTVVRFGKEKVNDISRPQLLSTFLFGSDAYILTSGSVPLGHETKWRAPSGEVGSQPAMQSSRYIAHFDHDGNYMGAVHLDLPFQPLHLGVFDDGDFLIAGMEPSTGEPRVAIVGSNGQFRRYIELKGDVHLQDESDAPNKRNDLTALPRYRPSQTHGESLFDVVSLSQIAKDGPNLLLFRPFNGPVFSISAAGQVEVHKLGAEGDYRLFTIKPTSSAWIVELIREIPSHGAAEEFMTLAFDPQTDSPLREYFFPADLGWGLACTDGNEFTFVMADTESRNLKLVTLAPASGSN